MFLAQRRETVLENFFSDFQRFRIKPQPGISAGQGFLEQGETFGLAAQLGVELVCGVVESFGNRHLLTIDFRVRPLKDIRQKIADRLGILQREVLGVPLIGGLREAAFGQCLGLPRPDRLPRARDSGNDEQKQKACRHQQLCAVALGELADEVGRRRRLCGDRLAGDEPPDILRERIRRLIPALAGFFDRLHHDPLQVGGNDPVQAAA